MSPACVETFALRPGVATTVTADDDLVLEAPPHDVSLGPATDGLRSFVTLLAERRCTAEDLLVALGQGGASALPGTVVHLIERLRAGAFLAVDVAYEGAPRYGIRPARLPPAAESTGDDDELVLSRFVVVRRDGSELVVESPRAWCEIRLADASLLGVLGAVARPVQRRELELPGPLPLAERLLEDLRRAGMVVGAGDAEDRELRLCQWSPFELWMHSRSRLDVRAGFNGGWGATGWAEGRFPPLPARHDGFGGDGVDLFRPDLDALGRSDPTLTAVVESRRSVRDHDDGDPLTLERLGEFLYRCARVRQVSVLEGIEHVDRPFPSGGALHELELYPVVRRVAGVDAGLYHYDGHGHRLERVCGDNPAVQRLVATAGLATSCPSPQVVIVVSARFARLLWKYEGMGYAAILKNVGVLYQTMYLVATAMGLAACAIGGGDATTFNDATGLDYFAESAVGEFVLGTPAPAASEEAVATDGAGV